MNRRAVLAAALAAPGLATEASATTRRPVETIPLWPNGAPGLASVSAREVAQVVEDQGRKGRDISGVHAPRLNLHRPTTAADTAILLIPGGAFNRVVFDKEGEEVGRRLAEAGYAAGSLLYRLPGDGWPDGQDVMLQDAARALRLLARRSGARRVGILGFSAGGTIAGALAARAADVTYPAVDETDADPLRIDFLAFGYAYLGAPASAPKPLYPGPPKNPPPAFFFHAADDRRVGVENSLQAFQAWRAAGAEAALHVFERGGHGFGLRAPPASSAAAWPDLLLSWLRELKATPAAS